MEKFPGVEKYKKITVTKDKKEEEKVKQIP